MCLATVYKENDDSVIFKNVSRINVDGNKLVLRGDYDKISIQKSGWGGAENSQ